MSDDSKDDLARRLSPYVIVLIPTGNRGADRYYAMQHAEKAVTLYDEFRNNTLFVPTAQFMKYPGNDTYNGGYHYDGRADVYTHIGRAFGHGMLKLMGIYRHHNLRIKSTGTRESEPTLRGIATTNPFLAWVLGTSSITSSFGETVA